MTKTYIVEEFYQYLSKQLEIYEGTPVDLDRIKKHSNELASRLGLEVHSIRFIKGTKFNGGMNTVEIEVREMEIK